MRNLYFTLGLLLLQFSGLVSAEECTTEGEVRLADGATVDEGRVEVCVDGLWGTVCDHTWGAAEARVVCNQLGLPAEHADAFYRYGGGSGPIHYAGFGCTGDETRLVDCTAAQQASIAEITNCEHFEDAGVRCTNAPCVENDTRLNEEVVQICHDQEWGLVCGSDWDDLAAEVMCNQVGIPSQFVRGATRRLIFYDAPVVLKSVTCTGTEDNIIECGLIYNIVNICTTIAVTQCEVQIPCSSSMDTIRLAQFSSNTLGRLEVCSGDRWGTVCGEGANLDTIATVACRELNHAAGIAGVESDVGIALSLIPITRTNMVCTGTEDAISECDFDGGTGNPDCDHSDDIIVLCSARECNESDVRLVEGQTPDDGRVEICLNGLWGGVCDDRWDIRDAEVVCRQLQYNGPSYPLISHGNPNALEPIIHLDDVHCDGSESMLSECSHRGIGIHDCSEGVEEAGVICTNATCEDGTVHLVGGSDVSRGRVEYCYEGTWYAVCASGWEDNGEEARVICSTLGYSSVDAIITNFGRGTSPILPLSIECGVDDTALSDCTTTNINVTQCPYVAGVNCGALCLTVGVTDCGLCTSRDDCGVTSDDQPLCECYSDCYEYGDCCTDVSHVENCVVEECESGEIRLVGGVTNSTGRLEVCANRIWGRVCNRFKYWGPDNARVVCRQLSYSEDGAYVVDDASVFGTSDENPLFGEVHCVGTEPNLFECSHSSVGFHQCGRHQTPVPDIAISCFDEATSCEDGDVRLEGGFSDPNGRVEFCQYRTWGAVCGEGWDDNDARVVCGQLGYSNPEDARIVEGFEMPEGTPVFLDGVECSGTETQLSDCMNTTTTSQCSSAGVTCEKSSNADRCIASDPLGLATESPSLGECEVYDFQADVCNGALTLRSDNVYISNRLGHTQRSISELLNDKIQSVENLIASHDKDCVEQVYRVICHYYLPPCGNVTHPLPPSSLCREECVYVEETCQTTWQAAQIVFTDPPFIDCEDTSQLLSPLPHCCTGASIEFSNIPESTSAFNTVPTTSMLASSPPPVIERIGGGGIGGGAVAGIVIVVLIVAVAVAIVAAFIFRKYFKNNKAKKMERVQMDIMAVPAVYNAPVVLTNAVYEAPQEAPQEARPVEPEAKNSEALIPAATLTIPNPYSVPRTTRQASSESLPIYENRARVPSQYLRELTRGKFIVRYKDITLLETIGEGEFGIVYKGKVPGARSTREVAVKTLKGDFDQIEVDQFVEESMKMSRFKHSHVMGLIGVCLDTGSAPFIIMPYMANGSLLKYLRRERENIVLPEDHDREEVQEVRKRLMVMCSQIASGMEYLVSEKYVHRDLAARNCMIDTHFLIKITDFGLSEDVFVRNYFRQGTSEDVVKLPVKWMAPESLSDGHFSEKSDVWSYGVVMWEVFSGGKAPFPGTDPLTLMQCLETGQRMPKPYNAACSDEIYIMMKKCWEKVPRDRPTFKELHSNISKFIEHIAGYLDMGFNPFSGGTKEAGSSYDDGVELKGEKEGEEGGFQVQVTPPSVQANGAHTDFTD